MKQLHSTDQMTMAYINLYGVLGSLEELCALDEEARKLVSDKKISIGFQVAGGPCATLAFDNGSCRMRNGVEKCDIKLPFSSPEKFNGMIDGTVTPIPSKGLTKVKFLLHEFKQLTDILTKYMRATPEELQDRDFFIKSTTLMFYTITVALSQIGNHDKIGKASAGYIPDGTICLRIKSGPSATIGASGHLLSTTKKAPEDPTATMEFGSMEVARALFEGTSNALAGIGVGDIRLNGMVLMLDNINRILDRVGLYLA